MAFDPSQPFEVVGASEKPAFDPSQPFTVAEPTPVTPEFDPAKPFVIQSRAPAYQQSERPTLATRLLLRTDALSERAGQAIVEPFLGLGRDLSTAGKVAGGVATDIAMGGLGRKPGELLPSMNDFRNTAAASRGEALPDEAQLGTGGKLLKAAAEGTPAFAASMFLPGGPVARAVGFGLTTAAQSAAEGGTPLQVATSAALAATFPKVAELATEGAGQLLGKSLMKFTEAATTPEEQAAAKLLTGSRGVQKAVETAVGQTVATAYAEASHLPDYVNATPDQRKDMLIRAAGQSLPYFLLQIPYLNNREASITQRVIQDDLPFVINHVTLAQPDIIDFKAREAFNPRNAQVFREPQPRISTEGATYASDTESVPQGVQVQPAGIGREIQTDGQNRQQPPSIPQESNQAGVGDRLPNAAQQPVAPIQPPDIEKAAEDYADVRAMPYLDAQRFRTPQQQLQAVTEQINNEVSGALRQSPSAPRVLVRESYSIGGDNAAQSAGQQLKEAVLRSLGWEYDRTTIGRDRLGNLTISLRRLPGFAPVEPVAPQPVAPAPPPPAPVAPAVPQEPEIPAEEPGQPLAERGIEPPTNSFLTLSNSAGYGEALPTKGAYGKAISPVRNQTWDSFADLTQSPLLYHETSIDNARQILGRGLGKAVGSWNRFYLSDNIDLALGQGGKGIVLLIDPTRSNGYFTEQGVGAQTGRDLGIAREFGLERSAGNAWKGLLVRDADLLPRLLTAQKYDWVRRFFDTQNPVETTSGTVLARKGSKLTADQIKDIVEPQAEHLPEPEGEVSFLEPEDAGPAPAPEPEPAKAPAEEPAAAVEPAEPEAPAFRFRKREPNESRADYKRAKLAAGYVPRKVGPEGVRKTLFIRPRSDGVYDIIDAIHDLGGAKPPSLSKFADKGEYDSWKETFNTGEARLLRNTKTGRPPDELLDQLRDPENGLGQIFKVESTMDIRDMVQAAMEQRLALKKSESKRNAEDEFHAAALKNEGKTPRQMGDEKIPTGQLEKGDKWKIKGAPVHVVDKDPATGEVFVEDGTKYPRTTLPPDSTLYPDKGSWQPVRTGDLPDDLAQAHTAIHQMAREHVANTMSGYGPADQDAARTWITSRATEAADKFHQEYGTLKGFSGMTAVRSRAANWIRDIGRKLPSNVSLEGPVGEGERSLAESLPAEGVSPVEEQIAFESRQQAVDLADQFRKTLTPEELQAFNAALESDDRTGLAPYMQRYGEFLKSKGIGPDMLQSDLSQAQRSYGAELLPDKANDILSESGTVAEILNAIASSDSQFAELATELLRNGDKDGLAVNVWRNDSRERSYYRPDADHIVIATRTERPPTGEVLHEIIHAFTARKIPSWLDGWEGNLAGPLYQQALNAALTDPTLAPELKELINVYKQALEAYGKTNSLKLVGDPNAMSQAGQHYGLGNLDEFMAEAFSRKEFQEFLNEIPGSDGRTLWQKFVDIIRRILGIPAKVGSLLEDAIRASAAFIAKERPGSEFSTTTRQSAPQRGLQTALEQAPRIEAERGSSAAERAVRLGQAGEVIGGQQRAQDAVANLRALAQSTPTDSLGRYQRDVARLTLSDRFFKGQVVHRVNDYLEAQSRLRGATETLRTLSADPNATDEEKSAAFGYAFNALKEFNEARSAFDRQYATLRPNLLNDLSKTSRAEAEALSDREVADQLMDDFRTLGAIALQSNRQAGEWAAYRRALNSNASLRRVLRWVSENVNFTGTGLHAGGITDTAGVLRLFENAARPMYTPDHDSLERVIGANDETIRAVARMILLSEPLAARIEDSKTVASGRAYTAPINQIKTRMAEALRTGNYQAAQRLFTEGVGDTAVEREESKKAVNFYQARTRRLIHRISALDNVKRITDDLVSDPHFKDTSREVASHLNDAEFFHDNNGTGIRLKPVDPATPPVEIRLGNSVKDWEKNFDAMRDLYFQYRNYIADTAAPDYDQRKAQGMQRAVDFMEPLMGLGNDPRNARLLPLVENARRKITDSFGQQIAIPNFSAGYFAGPAGANMKAHLRNYAATTEATRAQLSKHYASHHAALDAATKSHGGIDPSVWNDKVYRPLAATRQNFNDPVVLNVGDQIGNGEKITAADIAFLRADQNFVKDVIKVVNGTADETLKAITDMPGGIVYDKSGIRLPFAHGPNTLPRAWPRETMDWLTEWKSSDETQKENFLDKNLDRFVLGYLYGTRAADYKFQYSYPAQTYTVLNAAKGGEPIRSFADMAERVYDLVALDPGMPAKTLDEVRTDLMGDFNRIFESIERVKDTPDGPIGVDKSDLSVIGGSSPFNTARGKLIMPPGWYDYGAVTEGDRIILTKQAEMPSALGLKNALQTLVGALRRIVADNQTKLTLNPNAKSEAAALARRGEIYYDHAQAAKALTAADQELKNIDAYLTAKDSVVASERPNETRYRGATGLVISTITGAPTAFIGNLAGAAFQTSLLRAHVLGQGTVRALAAEAKQQIPKALREVAYLLTHEGNPQGRILYKLLKNASSRRIIGGIAHSIVEFAEKQRALYQFNRNLGIGLNYPLKAQLSAMQAFAEQGGRAQEFRPPSRGGKAYNRLQTKLMQASRVVGAAGVNKADSYINAGATGEAEYWMQDLKKIAQEFGPSIEEGARIGGFDPFDWTDPRNRFPDKAVASTASLGDKLTPQAVAARKREFWQNRVGINIDKLMLDYYKRWKDSGEDPNTPLLTKDEHNQLIFSLAEAVNLGTYASRPAWARLNALSSRLSTLLGYPNMAMQQFETFFHQLSNERWNKDKVKYLPHYLKLALIAAVIAVFGNQLPRAELSRLLNKEPAFPTILDAQNPKQAGITTLSAIADQIPFYGSAINMALNRGFSTGFDLNNMFVEINLLGDMLKTGRKIFETGDPIRPLQQFGTRWVFPLNVVGRSLPNVSGLSEIANARNIISSGGRTAGLEGLLRKPQAGSSSSDMTYSPATPIVDEAVNAIGKGDIPSFQAAFGKLVEYRRQKGDAKPEQSALRQIQSRDPIRTVFSHKLSDDESKALFSAIGPDRAAKLQGVLDNFAKAEASVKPARANKAKTGTPQPKSRLALRGFTRPKLTRFRALGFARASSRTPRTSTTTTRTPNASNTAGIRRSPLAFRM